LNWNAFNGNTNTGVKNGGLRENKPIASSIYKQQTKSSQDINNEVRIIFIFIISYNKKDFFFIAE